MADPQSQDIETGAGVPESDDQQIQDVPKNTTAEKTTAVIATTAVATSVAAIVLVGSPVVIVAGVLSSGIGPYVYWQQTQLADVKALKETYEAITKEVDNLSIENDRLDKLVKELTETVTKLEDIEGALDVLTATQGASVDEFRSQVEENKKILNKMEKNLKGNVLQNMLSVIVRSDTDGDFSIDDKELDDLILRISHINGVTLYEDRFRAAIKESGGNLKSVMGVVRNLLMNEDDGKDPIFTLSEE